jgi:predicted lipoprotein with Yx(FWY)xxD motif
MKMLQKTPRGAASRSTAVGWLAAVFGFALVLSAYGLGSTAAIAKPKSAPPTVKIAKVAGIGAVLVDAQGKTLYTLTNAGQPVACTGACPAAWPPLVVKAGTKVKGAKGVSGLGVAADGVHVTVKGLPVYRFAVDTGPGMAKGEGLNSFGGVWHVVKTSGKAAKTTSTTSSGSGYGY